MVLLPLLLVFLLFDMFGLSAHLSRIHLGELIQELEGVEIPNLLGWDNCLLPVRLC